MKRIATVGSLVGLVLSVFMVSLAVGEDPTIEKKPEIIVIEIPRYDATGIWDWQSSRGILDCDNSSYSGIKSTFSIFQTGSNFKIETSSGKIYHGVIKGNRYHVHLLKYYTIGAAILESYVWNLDSSSVGKGYLTETYLLNDGEDFCNKTYELHLQKHGDCTPSDTRMCLQNGRFTVRVFWEDEHGNTGGGHAIPSTDDSGLFWFFSKNNMELLIKVLDGCSINNRYWVFFAATTDQKFTVRITDLTTEEQVEYTNPLKHAADAVTDTDAFDTCP